MSFQIKPATRQGLKPLIIAYSESGCGKTFSSLLLARGIAGKGKIILADSESGRGSLYADIPEIGGYQTLDLSPPFSPSRYVDAIDAIEDAGADVGIIDSGSHEWENIGGVLDMAGEIEQRTGKAGLHCWKTPKFEHAKFVQRLLRTKIPFIVCLRAKYKSRQVKVDGKTQIIKDDCTSPIQADDFFFEATCHFEILPNHTIVLTKISHPALRGCFPSDKTEPLSVKHGEAIAKWCNGGVIQTAKPLPVKDGELNALKKKLWTITESIHGGNTENLQQMLWDEMLMPLEKTVSDLTASEIFRIIQTIEKTKQTLNAL